VVRPGRKTGTRRGARRKRATIARVRWARRAGRAGKAGARGPATAKFTIIVVAAAAVIATAADRREAILRTISIVTS
jgi:hypothetical protein